MRIPISAAFVVAMLLTGCGKPQFVTASQVDAPVLLSRVDRVGGHLPDRPARVVGVVDAEAGRRAAVQTERHGDVVVTRHTAQDLPEDLINAQLAAAAGHDPTIDVHVDRLHAGSYFFFFGGYGVAERWVGVKARAFRKEQVK